MRIILYPYKMGSRSVKVLARGLDAKRVYPAGRYRPRENDLIINWGNTRHPEFINGKGVFLNNPLNVRNAVNKIKTFKILSEAGIPTVEWTEDKDEAEHWDYVVCRRLVESSGGNGIEIYSSDEQLPNVPLYTKFVNQKAEYRVHVFNGEIIDYVKKRRRNGSPALFEEKMVRNFKNGWIFTRNNLKRLERVERLAIDAVNALGLHFGCVDIVKDENNQCMILEVNTACGMEGSTVEAYIKAIQNYAS